MIDEEINFCYNVVNKSIGAFNMLNLIQRVKKPKFFFVLKNLDTKTEKV